MDAGDSDAIFALRRIEIIEREIIEREITMSKFRNIDLIIHKKYKSETEFICIICKEEHKTIINLNCGHKHDHLYCEQCALTWYGTNPMTCLICVCQIDPDNIFLNICGE